MKKREGQGQKWVMRRSLRNYPEYSLAFRTCLGVKGVWGKVCDGSAWLGGPGAVDTLGGQHPLREGGSYLQVPTSPPTAPGLFPLSGLLTMLSRRRSSIHQQILLTDSPLWAGHCPTCQGHMAVSETESCPWGTCAPMGPEEFVFNQKQSEQMRWTHPKGCLENKSPNALWEPSNGFTALLCQS